MQVTKNIPTSFNTPAREMTMEAMQADFEYQIAQKLTKNLLEGGFLTVDEYDKICALNRKKFYPFMAELLE